MRLGLVSTRCTFFFSFLFLFSCAQPVCFGRRLLFCSAASGGEAPGRRGCDRRKKGRPARHRSGGEAKSPGLTVFKWRGVGCNGSGGVQNAEKCPFCMCVHVRLITPAEENEKKRLAGGPQEGAVDPHRRCRQKERHARACTCAQFKSGLCAKQALFFLGTFQALKYDN